MFQVVVVGAGFISQNHIDAISSLEDARVVALVGHDPERARKAAERAHCPAFPTLAEAVAQTHANAVIICVPTWLHEPFVIEAANLKCHVLCEKPITFTPASFDRMTKACEENGVRFMVAQVARWWPEFIAVKDMIRAGKLGDIRTIYEKRLCQHPTWSTWHRDPEKSGGGLYDLNIHDIDYLYDLFGKPERIYATGWKSPTGCWNHVCTNLTWASGVQAICETGTEMTGNWPFSIELRATGDKGTVSYTLTAGLNINDGDRGSQFHWFPVGEDTVYPVQAPEVDMFAAEQRAFFDAIRNGTAMPVTAEQSRGVLEVIEATRKSLEEGIVVTL